MQKLFIFLAALFSIAFPKAAQGIDIEGPYVSGLAGLNILHYHNKYCKKNYRVGWNTGLTWGYRFCNGFRAEGEINYRYNRTRTEKKFEEDRFRVGGNVFTWAFMANAFYEIPFFFSITPYLGAGLGYVAQEKEVVKRKRIKKPPGFKSKIDNSRDKGIAWQVIGGALYQIDDCLEMGLQYTYHRIFNNRYRNNTINLRLNWFY